MTEFTSEWIAGQRKVFQNYVWYEWNRHIQLEVLDHIEKQAKRIAELEAEKQTGWVKWLESVNVHLFNEQSKRIEELEQERRWIPVSERMPEEDGYYNIAFSISNAKNITDIYYFKSDSKCKWYSDIYCRSVATFFDTVSHWQNTIKPPESEGG